MKVRALVVTMATMALIAGVWLIRSVHAAGDKPQIELNADNMGPRPIEDLTRDHITRDYGRAWQTMRQALESDNPSLLDAYFTGSAKTDLANKIAGQKQTGVRVRYEDRGHKLDGIFYSPAGDAMQLRDRAQFEMQVLDGDKVIHTEDVNMNYIVLMTPGADRWLVRYLQSTPGGQRPAAR
jgi:hypothetical protein